MSHRISYICPRCEAVHSVEEHRNSLFCRKCGSFLRRKYLTVEQSSMLVRKKDKRGLERFFPYSSSRPYQREAIDFAFNIIRNRKIGLLSSPCGTGKSISVLTAFFMAKELNNSIGRLLALTRTRNQLEIYCRELRRIKEHSGVNFVASIFKGKKGMCPYVRQNGRFKNLSYRDFLLYCRNMKDGVFGRTCEYYERTFKGRKLSWRGYHVVNEIKKISPLLPDEVYEMSVDEGVCPYEVTKALAKYADVIVGNYNYLLVDSVRQSIFGGAGIEVDNVNCIFDEAHSLPYYVVGILSDELSSTSVRRAQREAENFDVDDFGFLEALYDVTVELRRQVHKNFGLNVEHVIETREIMDPLLARLRMRSDQLLENISELFDVGEVIRYKRAEAGENPISYVSRCAAFVESWVSREDPSFAKYIKVELDVRKRRNVKLGIRCLDPALAASIVNKLRSAILMSGTLWHSKYYIDVLGIERTRSESIELPSPFPLENRLVVVDTSVTTKFEMRSEEQWKRIADHLRRIVNHVKGRVAVYFPSYEIMRKVTNAASFDLPFIVETKGTKIVDVLRFLKFNDHCIVFGVARGKISEGVDMSIDGRSLLSAVIVVGLPYPKRTELQIALVKYFREKFGNKAMEYANSIPCLNALAQSAGRLLRSPEDKGIIILMDRRSAEWFKQKLPKDWRDNMKAHQKIEKILERIETFKTGHGPRL